MFLKIGTIAFIAMSFFLMAMEEMSEKSDKSATDSAFFEQYRSLIRYTLKDGSFVTLSPVEWGIKTPVPVKENMDPRAN